MPEDRIDLFNSWAPDYDQAVNQSQSRESYPFAGYDDVVATVIHLAGIRPEHIVLDIGAGTGNLTAKLVDQASEVWGTDFSEKMLEKAKRKVPQAHLVRWNMQNAWPADLPVKFDRVVSTYALHHLEDEEKVRFLTGLVTQRLCPGGSVIVGDIAFPNEKAQAICRESAASDWDQSEHYWIASRIIPLLEGEGLNVDYRQVSFCAGVFALRLQEPQ